MRVAASYDTGVVYFGETQRFRQWLLWVILIGVAAPFWFGAWQQLVADRPWGTSPASDGVLLAVWLFAGLLLPAWFGVLKLCTEVRDDGIAVRFTPFFSARRFWRWPEIDSVRAREYSPIREFGGWGIRWAGRTTAWNVSGRQGIELALNSGRRVLIGTRDPEGFLAAVEQARGSAWTQAAHPSTRKRWSDAG